MQQKMISLWYLVKYIGQCGGERYMRMFSRNKSKWLIRMGAAVVAALALGCFIIWTSILKLTEGVVVDKTFQPAYTEVYTVRSGTVDNSHTDVRTRHHSASWSIKVSGVTDEGKSCVEWWDVGEALYGMIEVGDMVQRNPKTNIVSIVDR